MSRVDGTTDVDNLKRHILENQSFKDLHPKTFNIAQINENAMLESDLNQEDSMEDEANVVNPPISTVFNPDRCTELCGNTTPTMKEFPESQLQNSNVIEFTSTTNPLEIPWTFMAVPRDNQVMPSHNMKNTQS
ncbi:hypothetical protein KIN20_031279 [Parelaphostrongylus tenuis]|uniref:Uncharacterized protein n=1 Tax=Parelaphostrongylus tenuis TaxID=148309 RepID=A0AAD5R4W4_PARTN|nr:hypothetical protein KIN20_031279 [Parelaphostrongylus tenuis]